jgi:hypothetical protein
MNRPFFHGLITISIGLFLAGCNVSKNSSPNASHPAAKEEAADHAHGAGPHGGTVADWGRYHIEFCVDHAKQEATVYVLRGDAKTPAPIKTDKLLLSIKEPAFQIDLKALPLDSDPKGAASRFVGKHEKLGKEQEFAGTVSGEIDGKKITGDFKEEPEPTNPKDKTK